MSELKRFGIGLAFCALTFAALWPWIPMHRRPDETTKHMRIAEHAVAVEQLAERAQEHMSHAETFAEYREVLAEQLRDQDQALERIRSRKGRPPARASELVDRFIAAGYGHKGAVHE